MTAALKAGSPCPRGCMIGYPGHEEPELLTANIDGELSCPTCWECFGIASEYRERVEHARQVEARTTNERIRVELREARERPS